MIIVGTLGALELDEVTAELVTDALELTTAALELVATEVGLVGVEPPPPPPPPHATKNELSVTRLKY